MKKITVRKAGPVKLTSPAHALYNLFAVGTRLPGCGPIFVLA
jgi:hypothetical protein